MGRIKKFGKSKFRGNQLKKIPGSVGENESLRNLKSCESASAKKICLCENNSHSDFNVSDDSGYILINLNILTALITISVVGVSTVREQAQ